MIHACRYEHGVSCGEGFASSIVEQDALSLHHNVQFVLLVGSLFVGAQWERAQQAQGATLREGRKALSLFDLCIRTRFRQGEHSTSHVCLHGAAPTLSATERSV